MENNSPVLPYTEIGGAFTGKYQIGTWNCTVPFAQLSVSLGTAQLKIFWFKKYKFAPNEIQKVEPFNGIFSRGIRIVHNRKDYPAFMVFWSFSNIDFWKAKFSEAGFKLPS